MSLKSPSSRIPVEENESFDLSAVLNKYIYNWYWFVSSIILFLVLGFFYISFQTPVYLIEGKLLIKDNVKESNSVNSQANSLDGFDLFSSNKVLDNEIALLKSNTFLEKTIKDLNLQVNVLYKKNIGKVDLYGDSVIKVYAVNPTPEAYLDYIKLYPISATTFKIDGKTYPFNQLIYTRYGAFAINSQDSISRYIGKTLLLKVNDVNDLVDAYNANLTIDQASSQGTVLLIDLKDQVPQRGKDFINKLIEVYNVSSIRDKNAVTSNSLKFIEGRIDSISSELSGVEKQVQQYKSTNDITDISSQSRIYLENQQQNDNDLSKILIQLNVIQGLEDYLNGKQGSLPSTLGLDDPTLNGLVTQLSSALNNKESLLRTIPESNPIIGSLNDQISSLKKSIYADVENIKSGLIITRNHLQAKSNQFESAIQTVPTKERGLLDVMRQQDIKNNLFTFLLEKREETQLALASNLSNSQVVDMPRSSKHPVSPKKTVIYAIFLILGLAFPATVFFILDVLNNKIKSRMDIEKITRIPIIAEIAYSKETTVLAPVERPRSIIAEHIRALRTNLTSINGTSPKTILFTSTISGEGKSFISLNVGSSLASIGKKVLIIELDMRKPRLHVNLNIKNQPGLSDYLNGNIDYKSIIQPVMQQPNYFIITCGTIPPDPAELLHNPNLITLMDILKKEYDHVILDAPPVGLVTDAQILEKFADATMFIVRYKYSFKTHIQMINRLFTEKKFRNMSIILNSVDMQAQGYGYKNGYGYYENASAVAWYKSVLKKNKNH